ncbi:hypothetical protein HYV72_01090 [Candidatus Uhrbacteria bacterium]|nr:hypothetical protein [Candidatus Uhrbacteria bacterium]
MGDEELGSYNVILEHQPSIVLVGYDQDELQRDLEAWVEDHDMDVRFHKGSPYSPEVFKTSILREVADEVL